MKRVAVRATGRVDVPFEADTFIDLDEIDPYTQAALRAQEAIRTKVLEVLRYEDILVESVEKA